MSRTDVGETLREMWETRPARPRDDRQVAGVAAGIARRYDIDPVLVRVGFVVAAFSGIGAALYVAGWILLPDEPAGATARPPNRPRTWLVIALAVAAAVTMGSVFGGNGPDVILPLLVVAGLLYLLHRSRGDRTAAADATTVAAPMPAAAPDATGAAGSTEPPPATPPAWDPLGAAPFAWDLPEPAPPPAAPPPRKLPVTPVTLGLALIAGSATAVIMMLGGMMTLANLAVLCGVVLAVLGAGLVVGAFLRTGRGLVPFALLLGVLTWALVAAPVDRWQGDGYGELVAAPTTVAGLQPSYERGAGEIDLDLRNLDLAVPADGNASPVRTRISMGAGDVQVRVPENADVTLTATAGFGDVRFGAVEDDGPDAHVQVIDDLGADGVRAGRPLVIDIDAGVADVEVRRG